MPTMAISVSLIPVSSGMAGNPHQATQPAVWPIIVKLL
jgi:hypothetical protein